MFSDFQYQSPTAIILTGGKSTRMGYDKALLKLNSVTLLERTINLVTPQFGKIILSVNEKNLYPNLHFEKAVDRYQGFGPLIGIYSALSESKTDKNFIISCDMPYQDEKFISFMLEHKSEKDVIIPVENGKMHPLCGIYSKKILPSLEIFIQINLPADLNVSGKVKSLSIKNFLKSQSVEYVDVEKEYANYEPKLFFNINTMEDYEKVKTDFEK